MEHCACGILVERGRILLGKRAANSKNRPNVWDILGGHCEPGETLEQALVRELEEEAGVTPIEFRKITTLSEPRPDAYGPHRYHVFGITKWRGTGPVMKGEEHTELGWFTPEESLQLNLALPSYRLLFKQLLNVLS